MYVMFALSETSCLSSHIYVYRAGSIRVRGLSIYGRADKEARCMIGARCSCLSDSASNCKVHCTNVGADDSVRQRLRLPLALQHSTINILRPTMLEACLCHVIGDLVSVVTYIYIIYFTLSLLYVCLLVSLSVMLVY